MEFLFTVEGDFQLSSWSPFLESFKNHQKETNIAAKIKVVNICSNCGLEGFQEKGGMGGGGSPRGGEITAVRTWLHFKPFYGPDQPIPQS